MGYGQLGTRSASVAAHVLGFGGRMLSDLGMRHWPYGVSLLRKYQPYNTAQRGERRSPWQDNSVHDSRH